jgi:hypothetical protein
MRSSTREGDHCSSLGDNLMKTMDSNSFCVEQGKPRAYSTYKSSIESFLFYSMYVM